MQADVLSGGFTDPTAMGAYAFREVMEAMARPGTIRTIAGANPPESTTVAIRLNFVLCAPP